MMTSVMHRPCWVASPSVTAGKNRARYSRRNFSVGCGDENIRHRVPRPLARPSLMLEYAASAVVYV